MATCALIQVGLQSVFETQTKPALKQLASITLAPQLPICLRVRGNTRCAWQAPKTVICLFGPRGSWGGSRQREY